MKTFRFDSMQALAEYVIENQAVSTAVTSSIDGSLDTGGLSKDEAIEMITEKGGYWPEGVKAMRKAELEQGEMIVKEIPTRKPKRKYTGSRASVNAMLAGEPKIMMQRTHASTYRPVLKMAVHVGRIYKIKQRPAMNRGAAILSVIKELHHKGYQVELWAIWRNSDGETTVSVETLLKTAEQSFSAADIAYALGHVAFQRRLCWAVCESTEESAVITGSYGSGVGQDFKEYDLHVPYMLTGKQWMSAPKALAYITSQINYQLQALKSAA